MESLESKLDRLSPGQRREIEDFVDFLLSRSGQAYVPLQPPPVLNVAPPPLTLMRQEQGGEIRPFSVQDTSRSDEGAVPVTRDEAAPAPFQEVGGGPQDRITHDYMDYGQFDQQSSPAAEAVRKVKRKILAKEGQDKPRHLLDWVD